LCYDWVAIREVTQRELRNDSGQNNPDGFAPLDRLIDVKRVQQQPTT
jgi:hypothetical protein